LRDGPPREDARRAWSLGAVATAITLLFFGILGSAVVSMSDLLEPERPAATSEPPAQPTEHIEFVPIPRATPPVAAEPVLPRPATVTAPRTTPSSRRASPRDSSVSPRVPIAPSPARQRDSSALAPNAAARPTTVEAPRVVFPTQPCDLDCAVRRGTAAGKGVGSLSAAERDSARREAARRVTDSPRRPTEARVADDAPPTGASPRQQGVSIPIGLPGGGPTAAQRKRARELDAEVSARLARIKARADSIQRARDSAAARKQP
jgi:hypothetical protein